ncbi:hypothetical protein [Celeribacter neptunius]|nr:hypothetical protein [Celeribacter neptunius]
MKRLVLILGLSLSPAAHAQETPPSDDGAEGWSMLREGSRLLLQQLFDEMKPALEDLEGFVDDLNAYEPPVVLPNGDILIRRKPEAPQPDSPDETAPGDPENSIDL